MKRRALIATACVAATAGCLGSDSNADPFSRPESDVDLEEVKEDSDAVVTMSLDPAFEPRVLEIDVGDTVAWVNESPRTQTVTASERNIPDDAEYFASGGSRREAVATVLYPIRGGVHSGDVFTHTFETPGVYEYYSIPAEHEGMDGRVIVE